MEEFFTVREVPVGETVVLDVPLGRLRAGGTVKDGIGTMVFSISEEAREAGSRPGHTRGDREALRLIVQSPEKAEAIAMAFLEMAHKLHEQELDDGEQELEAELDGEIVVEYDLPDDCPMRRCCRGCGG